MPKEKFYDPSIAEDENPIEASGGMFSVAWGDDGDAIVAGVQMDASAITRLIKTLKKARPSTRRHVMVEIGQQRMTIAQFDAAQQPLRGNPGPIQRH